MAWLNDVCVQAWIGHVRAVPAPSRPWHSVDLGFMSKLRNPAGFDEACKWHKVSRALGLRFRYKLMEVARRLTWHG